MHWSHSRPCARRQLRPAGAADPGRWVETGYDSVPLEYFQGLTSDPHRNLFFDGLFVGLYRTDLDLSEEARNVSAIPVDVFERERYNHIGDITWDDRERGRVLLPLECFIPFIGNTCKTGLDRRRRSGDARVALLREARPGLHRQGDVGRGVSGREAAVDVERRPQRRQRPARLRHEGRSRRPTRRPAGPLLKPVRVLARRRPAERDHGRHLLQGPTAARGPARRAVPRVVGGPDRRLAPPRDREVDLRRVRGPRHREHCGAASCTG